MNDTCISSFQPAAVPFQFLAFAHASSVAQFIQTTKIFIPFLFLKFKRAPGFPFEFLVSLGSLGFLVSLGSLVSVDSLALEIPALGECTVEIPI